MTDSDRESLWPATSNRRGSLDGPGFEGQRCASSVAWRELEPLAVIGTAEGGGYLIKAARALLAADDDRDDRLLANIAGVGSEPQILEDFWTGIEAVAPLRRLDRGARRVSQAAVQAALPAGLSLGRLTVTLRFRGQGGPRSAT